MYRQHSSRNSRNRGIKVKHVLQISLLVAICFWLIYQVKRSHDKNEEFEVSDDKGLLDRGSIGGLIRIKRKSFQPLYEEVVTENENKPHNDATEEEETDEHEVERLDTEVYQEEYHGGDEVREDGIDSETEGYISGRKQDNSVDDGSLDRGDRSSHEAREEFYAADDASSAMTRGNDTQTTENEKEVVGISDQLREDVLEQENKENRSEEADDGEVKKVLEVDHGGEISDDANRSTATDTATYITTSKTEENNSDSSEKGLSPTDNSSEASNSTTDVTAEDHKLSTENVTESVPDLDEDQGIVTEGTSTEGSNLETIGLQQEKTSTLAVENHLSDSESTKSSESNLDDFSRPANNTFVRMKRSELFPEDGTNTEKNETVSDIPDFADLGDAKYPDTNLYTLPVVKELMVKFHLQNEDIL